MNRINKNIDESMSLVWDSLESEGTGGGDLSTRQERLSQLHSLMDSGSQRSGRRAARILAPALSAAAAVLLTVGVCALVMRPAVPETVTRLASAEGSKAFFNLPDGSKVWLNGESSLEFSGDLSTSEQRSVRLEGEAFFDVSKTGKPFVVSAGDLDVRVYGTRFNVCHSPRFDEDQVTLQSGKVAVSISGDKESVLSPGQQFSYNPSNGESRVDNVNVSSYSNWTGENLYFDNERLSDIVIGLEHWYNVRISLAGGVDGSIRLSFKLKPESVAETIHAICRIAGFHFHQEGNGTYVITE